MGFFIYKWKILFDKYAEIHIFLMSEVVYLRMVVNHEVHNLSNLIKEIISMTFKNTAARVAVVAALALTASSAMAGKDRDKDDDDKGGGHGCGRHHACTVPEPGTLALTTLAALGAVGIPAAMRRRRANKSQT